jgi:hypothetical protein
VKIFISHKLGFEGGIPPGRRKRGRQDFVILIELDAFCHIPLSKQSKYKKCIF